MAAEPRCEKGLAGCEIHPENAASVRRHLDASIAPTFDEWLHGPGPRGQHPQRVRKKMWRLLR
jgi:hypothetical protein